MLINQTYFIDSCDDVELNIKRESKLEFQLIYDDTKEIQAIMCIIQGLGADIRDPVLKFNMEYFASKYNVAVLSVNYHGIGNRPQTGAQWYLDDIDKLIFDASLKAIDIEIPYDISKLNTFEEFHPAMEYLNKEIQKKKDAWDFDRDYYLDLSVSLKLTNDEYQNYGIMQTIDMINTLLYVKANIFKNKDLKTIVVGVSHGAYMGILSAKIAPWTIDAIIDNSSHVTLDGDAWRYIGFGKEVDYTEYFCFGTFHYFNNIRLCASEKTLWTTNKQSPYYFSPARKLIRETLNKDHINIQAKYPNPKYIAYHSKFDEYIPLEEKEEYVNILKEHGLDVEFIKIIDEKQIDGKFIKNLTHGMGIPMKLLIKKHLPQILQEPLKDKTCKKEISYKCDDLIYTFKEENEQILLDVQKLN
ncbi:DUF2920 family protein [Campylobacter sp. IFREMER_LSEM_CL2090]|uniref:DUF2920 family protein n=1 Tax=Campylobacter sp. IFREMER_LSEM_CL2090 TaxID=2911617 RepID=UPI0021E88BDF|nr:DUF2920 family protein [Campylobacter sp. IFREMER_LSEM_CL2090]MCV3402577.1 DUF2920 family protein [Campylobacter sp. IFREMER_LSEM_CL2090]